MQTTDQSKKRNTTSKKEINLTSCTSQVFLDFFIVEDEFRIDSARASSASSQAEYRSNLLCLPPEKGKNFFNS